MIKILHFYFKSDCAVLFIILICHRTNGIISTVNFMGVGSVIPLAINLIALNRFIFRVL